MIICDDDEHVSSVGERWVWKDIEEVNIGPLEDAVTAVTYRN